MYFANQGQYCCKKLQLANFVSARITLFLCQSKRLLLLLYWHWMKQNKNRKLTVEKMSHSSHCCDNKRRRTVYVTSSPGWARLVLQWYLGNLQNGQTLLCTHFQIYGFKMNRQKVPTRGRAAFWRMSNIRRYSDRTKDRQMDFFVPNFLANWITLKVNKFWGISKGIQLK